MIMAGNKNSGRRSLSVEQRSEIAQRIISLVKAGSPFTTAVAAAGGISLSEANKWLARGRDLIRESPESLDENDAMCLKFAEDIDVQVGRLEATIVNKILKAGDKDWKALAWVMEARFPKRWGKKINVTVKEELDAFLDKLEARLPEEVYEAVLCAASADELDGEAEQASFQENTSKSTH